MINLMISRLRKRGERKSRYETPRIRCEYKKKKFFTSPGDREGILGHRQLMGQIARMKNVGARKPAAPTVNKIDYYYNFLGQVRGGGRGLVSASGWEFRW